MLKNALLPVLCLALSAGPLLGQKKLQSVSPISQLKEMGWVDGKRIETEQFLDSIELGNLEVFELFLKTGVKVNVFDSLHRNPILIASEEGHIEMVRKLINLGADLSVRDQYKRNVFTLAARGGHSKVLLLLHDENVKRGQ